MLLNRNIRIVRPEVNQPRAARARRPRPVTTGAALSNHRAARAAYFLSSDRPVLGIRFSSRAPTVATSFFFATNACKWFGLAPRVSTIQ
jgi:hypothetical protein